MELRDQADWPNEERRCYTVAELPGHWVDVLPMIYNHRVVLTPKACPDVWDVGWCYPDLLTALAAVYLWDPGREPEPAGYLKRVGEPVELTAAAELPVSQSASDPRPALAIPASRGGAP